GLSPHFSPAQTISDESGPPPSLTQTSIETSSSHRSGGSSVNEMPMKWMALPPPRLPATPEPIPPPVASMFQANSSVWGSNPSHGSPAVQNSVPSSNVPVQSERSK